MFVSLSTGLRHVYLNYLSTVHTFVRGLNPDGLLFNQMDRTGKNKLDGVHGFTGVSVVSGSVPQVV